MARDSDEIRYPPSQDCDASCMESNFPDSARQSVHSDDALAKTREMPALPPPDTGYAWLFLVAAFFVELLCWGFAYSIGIFHSYWTSKLFPEPSAGGILTAASTLQTGLLYMVTPALSPIFTRYPEYRRVFQFGGLAVSVGGIILSAFASKPWHILLSAGVIYPVGGCTFYTSAVVLLYEWFQAKRGVATGVLYAGTGVGGVIFPFLMQALFNKFSYKAAVLSLAVGYAVFGSLAAVFIKERIPIPKKVANGPTPKRPKVPLSFLKRNTFYVFMASNLLVSLGVLLPAVYLPSFATEIGLSDQKGTLIVAVYNAASVPGLIIIGFLSDRLPTKVVVFVSCISAALCCFLFWGFATSLGLLLAFAITFGFFGMGYAAVWSSFITIVSKDDPLIPPIMYSCIAFTRGLGEAVSGPIATALMSGASMTNAKYGYGVNGYGGILLWTGSVFTLATVVGVAYRDK